MESGGEPPLGGQGDLFQAPAIPLDLASCSTDELVRLGSVLTDWRDGPTGGPPHPEAQTDLDRLAAELASRREGTP